MNHQNNLIKNLISMRKIVTAVLITVLAGCTPKVEYPVDNDISQKDLEFWPKKTENAAYIHSLGDPNLNKYLDERTSATFINADKMHSLYTEIESHNIRARIVGNIAQIETEFTIRNPNPEQASGYFIIPLTEGAVITGVAMNVMIHQIGNQMVDAVMLDDSSPGKSKIESSKLPDEQSNRYQVYIDTILPHGYRTIRLTYTMPLKPNPDGKVSVLLPMQKETLRKRSIQVSVYNSALEAPTLNESIESHFKKAGSAWVLEQTDNNILSKNDLILTIPDVSGETFYTNKYIERDPRNPEKLFVMFDIHPGKTQIPAQDLSHIRLIWDASGSRSSEDIKKSIEVVQRLPENSLYELHVFHHKTEPARTFKSRNELIRYLESIAYDGGTNYKSLKNIAESNYDGFTLIFTDGIDAYQNTMPSFGIRSAAILSGKTIHENDMWTASHGHIIRLDKLTSEQAFAEIQFPKLLPFDITGNHVSDIQWVNRGAKDHVSAIVKWDGIPDTVTIHLTDGTSYTAELSEKDEILESQVISKAWAMDAIQTLSDNTNANKDIIASISKNYAVPSPFTRMAILTSSELYIKYNIEPPESLTAINQEWTKHHHEMISKEAERTNVVDSLNKNTLNAWNQYVDWWNHPIPQNIKKSYYCYETTDCYERVESEYGFHYKKKFVPPKNWLCNESNHCYQPPLEDGWSDNSGGSGGGSYTRAKNEPIFVTSSHHEIQENKFISWDPETPYLKSLMERRKSGAKAESLYSEYLRLRPNYVLSSAFYFDVANYFFAENMHHYAIRVLSNLFEYYFDNNPTQVQCKEVTNNEIATYIIANTYVQRLINAGELDEALNVIETFYSPDKLSSCKDSDESLWLSMRAKVLDMRARKNNNPDDAQKALDDYYKLSFLSDGDISPMIHFNALSSWANHKKYKLNLPEIPGLNQLNQPLDVDLRINVDSNEYDVYSSVVVIEPTTEVVQNYDSNDKPKYEGLWRSSIGGTMDVKNDNGYVIKKANKGKYVISLPSNYELSYQSILGQEFVTTTIYRNWGRQNQSQEIIVTPLKFKSTNESSENSGEGSPENYYKKNQIAVVNIK